MKAPTHILITGASSGLGAALALEYAAFGVRLSLHGRDGDRLARIAAQTQRQGATVDIYQGDVTDAQDMAHWIAACDAQASLDLVIANAGISGGTAQGESTDQVGKIFATNVGGVFNTLRPALSFMTERRHGQIAIVSSLASFRGLSGAPAYCASKAAVRVYGEGLRGDMAAHGVEVNVICPGFIQTPMTDVNPFPMPFLMSPEKAARHIRKGLARNQGRIAFPWQVYAVVRVMAALPQRLMDHLAPHMPKK